MTKAAIIEDEKPAARRLQRLLEQRGIEVVALIHSVAEGLEWFSAHTSPDLLLVDIQLSDGLSFDIFKNCKVNSALIFTTAYDEYALQAFKLNSIHYLLKPISETDLDAALLKFKNWQKPLQDFNFETIKNLILQERDRTFKNRFSVKIGSQIKLINTDDIVCFYSSDKATYARTTDKRDYLLDFPLDTLEDTLNPKDFFRVSRQFIVAIRAIETITHFTNSRLQVKLGQAPDLSIIVSREKVKDFKNWME